MFKRLSQYGMIVSSGLTFCCVVSPIVLGLGLVLLLHVPSERVHQVSVFNDAVSKWRSTYWAELNASVFSLEGLTLEPDTTLSPLLSKLVEDGDVDTNYPALNYIVSSETLIPPQFLPATQQVSVEVSLTFQGSYASRPASPLTAPGVILCTSRTLSLDELGRCEIQGLADGGGSDVPSCAEVCKSKSGHFEESSHLCYIRTAVQQVCVKMALDLEGSGSWQTDSTYGGIGCSPNYNNIVSVPAWGPSELMPSGVVGAANVSLDAVIRLRSAHDPFVVAAALTNGSFSFGLTSSERFHIGLALSVSGGLASLLTMSTIAYLIKCGEGRWATGGNRGYRDRNISAAFLPRTDSPLMYRTIEGYGADDGRAW